MSILDNDQYQKILLEKILSNANARLSTVNPHGTKTSKAYTVYHNNYIENGIRAMSISFPTVFGLLGEDAFRALAKRYLLQHPKQCFDWADYGEQFASFMYNIDELGDMPFLPEIAELDWRLMHIERAQDVAFNADSFALLQTIPPEQLSFVCAPGMQIMQAIFPLFELYNLVHNPHFAENAPDKAEHLQRTNNLINNAMNAPQYRSLILWREQYKALFEYCDNAPKLAFESMLSTASIASVLAHFEEDEAAMSQWLQEHIAARKIYAIAEYKTSV